MILFSVLLIPVVWSEIPSMLHLRDLESFRNLYTPLRKALDVCKDHLICHSVLIPCKILLLHAKSQRTQHGDLHLALLLLCDKVDKTLYISSIMIDLDRSLLDRHRQRSFMQTLWSPWG